MGSALGAAIDERGDKVNTIKAISGVEVRGCKITAGKTYAVTEVRPKFLFINDDTGSKCKVSRTTSKMCGFQRESLAPVFDLSAA